MKPAAAASWYAPPVPGQRPEQRDHRGLAGCTWQKISGAQDQHRPASPSAAACGRPRPDRASSSTNAPISRPAGGAASSRSTVRPRRRPACAAYGAARPSGTTVVSPGQPNSTLRRARSAGVPKIVVEPARGGGFFFFFFFFFFFLYLFLGGVDAVQAVRRCRPGPRPAGQDARRRAERQRVQGQHPVQADRGHQPAARQQPGDLAQLGGLVADRAKR